MKNDLSIYPVSILHKSIAGRNRPVRVADGPITARCRFIKNASWVILVEKRNETKGTEIQRAINILDRKF